MKHLVCYSGGHSSALVAIDVVRRYGPENVVLLNHDINPRYEDADIKRFKAEVAAFLGLPITYANFMGLDNPDEISSQFVVCIAAKAFKVNNGQEFCTNRLKTVPFERYLLANHPPGTATIYYGFDANEESRIERRRKYLRAAGYDTAFPRAEWKTIINSTLEIGIAPPNTYSHFKHGNCKGCLKAGKQHWYVIYCLYPEIYREGKIAEDYIGYTIHPGESLTSLEPLFEAMHLAGITPSEHIPQQRFWADVTRFVRPKENGLGDVQNTIFMQMPCECVV